MTYSNLSLVELELYLHLFQHGQRHTTATPELILGEVAEALKMSRDNLERARKGLISRSLIREFRLPGNVYRFTLLNPKNKVPLRDPKGAEFRQPVVDDTRPSKRDWREEFTETDFRKFYQHYFPGAEFTSTRNQYRFLCPFHNDTKPSLSVNVETGRWFCHGACNDGGWLYEFEKRKAPGT